VLLLVATAALTGLLFSSGPGAGVPRSVGHLWNLGHVALFGLGTLLVLRARNGARPVAPWRHAARILAAAAVLGIASELLQAPFHRSPELADLARDLLGTCLALAFGPPRHWAFGRPALRAVRAAVLLALTGALAPLVTAGIDEFAAGRQFPVLGDFESRLELGRWAGSAGRSLSSEVSQSGQQSLRVGLGTEHYSGIALRYFPGDWGGYRFLRFAIYNPDPTPLALTCRVHDAHHRERGQTYADRFHRRIELRPGWNNVVIPLADVLDAPRGREMDLARIEGLGLFSVALPEPRVFYLDALRLEP